MNKKLVVILIFGIIALLFLIGFQLVNQYKKQVDTTLATSTTPIVTVVHIPKTITTHSGATYSATPIIDNKNTSVMTTNVYKNTLNTDMYDIIFNDDNGVGIILLYDENLKLARDTAEKQLLSVLPYTQVQICDMDIRVQTNEYVNKAYSDRKSVV